MRFSRSILFLLFLCSLEVHGEKSLEPQTVSFPTGEQKLQGYLWVPEGKGPFAAVVWSYGRNEGLFEQGASSQFSELAKFHVDNNYILFIPDRLRTGQTPRDAHARTPTPLEIALAMNEHMVAALSWLRQQSFVESTKVLVSGTLTGALQSLLAAQRDATIRGAVIFSPGAAVWDSRPDLRGTLLNTVQSTETPIFLIQPQNDKSLKPTETLGPILTERGGLNRSRIYPPFAGDIRNFAIDGVEVWGKDVLKFMDATMR